MTLREEIMLELNPNEPRVEGQLENLLELFKKWALEMVGEDEEIVFTKRGGVSALGDEQQLRNQAKQQIRQRIEDSTK